MRKMQLTQKDYDLRKIIALDDMKKTYDAMRIRMDNWIAQGDYIHRVRNWESDKKDLKVLKDRIQELENELKQNLDYY